MAMVVIVFLMFLFGIIEYCRFLWVRHLITFAAREGCRYCVVNTDNATPEADTRAVVASKLGKITSYTNYACGVYWSDANGANLGTVDKAQFGQLIAVRVSVDYKPIVPQLLFLKTKFTIRSTCMMNSEAN